ncbi:MAG: antiterminator LoaP [Lachnospiraceae bacterium]|nr:antiterminator LoaP [Lachnospiraceae bacterium]
MWYVIWTGVGNEEKVSQQLASMCPDGSSERYFIPKRCELIKYKKNWTCEDRILFPGYIFVETEAVEDVFFQLDKTVRPAKILRCDKEFVPVSEEERSFIHQLIGDDGVAGISIGEIKDHVVTITSGPLKGLEGIIKRIDRHKRRAYLEVDLFDRTINVRMALEVRA